MSPESSLAKEVTCQRYKYNVTEKVPQESGLSLEFKLLVAHATDVTVLIPLSSHFIIC